MTSIVILVHKCLQNYFKIVVIRHYENYNVYLFTVLSLILL